MTSGSNYLRMRSSQSDMFRHLIEYLKPMVLPLLLELAAMVGVYMVLT